MEGGKERMKEEKKGDNGKIERAKKGKQWEKGLSLRIIERAGKKWHWQK